MNIGIIAPSPVPYCVGGAEKLFWGLTEAINDNTSHHAELIKLPGRESSFSELIETYRNFASLDVSHFDMVISTKYPAWMVSHPNHSVYMLHKLRGLYDTYPKTFRPDYDFSIRLLKSLKEYIALTNADRSELEYLWELITYLRKDVDSGSPIFNFPGSLIREIIHYLDNIGLNPEYIKHYAAISKNVVSRRGYFPENTKVGVIYPPSSLKRFKTEKYEYFFTVSRLDAPKRVALLVEAMRLVKANVPLYIAGTGPDEEHIKSLAEGDKRIKFLGYVSDDELTEFYSDALAVPYIPYDEDYGLVTIEAMMSRKPVLTFTDSGGVNEFVENGKTGYSVAPNPAALAAKMDYMAETPDDARLMGQACYNKVKHITWKNTVSKILQEKSASPDIFSFSPAKKKKIVIAVTFPIYPPVGGGKLRIYNLYKNLTDFWDVDIVSFTEPYQERVSTEIAPGMREIRVPLSHRHWIDEFEYYKKLGMPVTDVLMSQLYKKTPEYTEALSKAVSGADIIIASHPYLIDSILDVNTGNLPVMYEAHNVEFFLKQAVLPSSESGAALLDAVRRAEAKSCGAASFIYATSQADAATIKEFYNVTDKKIAVIPNGVDTNEIPFTAKKEYGIDKRRSFLFIGSWHKPNMEAMHEIFRIADSFPDVEFQIAGSVCDSYRNEREIPPNVRPFGIISDKKKLELLAAADYSINPMLNGSGTNLKILEAFSAGLPVLSTPCGARGFGVEDGKHLIIREINEFEQGITDMLNTSPGKLENMRRQSRELTENKYEWQVIARELSAELKKFIS